MALTQLSTIKAVLQSNEVIIANNVDFETQLTLFEPSKLPHTNIDENSETVKIIRQSSPIADPGNPITLNLSTPYDLSPDYIVRGSVVVSDSLSLTTIYTENDDYIINYGDPDNPPIGSISRTTIGSTIPDGGSVYVWYVPFSALTSGSDYNINYAEGTLNRRAGTSIPNLATVYIDYSHSQNSITDSAILELISQSEAFIEPRLSSAYTLESDNKGLESAAVSLTLYYLSLSQSFKELQNARLDNSHNLSEQWLSLAEKYSALATNQLNKYLKQPISLDSPGVIQNRFSSKRKRTYYSPPLISRERRF